MTTSYDIARAAGVSQTTVSRVLHANPKVKPATRERVLEAMRDLNYEPDGLARAMVSRKTGTIGVVVEDITNPFYPEIVEALCSKLSAAGFRMTLWNTGAAVEPAALEAVRQRLVDGVIFTTATEESGVLKEAVHRGSPVVLVNRYVEEIACDRVTTDNVTGGRTIADYFLDHGHEDIALISGLPNASTSIERESSFRERLRERGVNLREDLHRVANFSNHLSYTAMISLLESPEPPTAVFCTNDMMAFGALNGARAVGARVPEDVWVVGFDDIAMSAWEISDLTTVSQPIVKMAGEAVRLLVRRMEEPGRDAQHVRLGGTEIIVRGSTAHKPPKSHQAVHPPSTSKV